MAIIGEVGWPGNNTIGQNTGQTPAPEPEKKSAWAAFKDFFGFGEDEYGNPKKNPIERLNDWVRKRDLERLAGGIVSDEIIDRWFEAGVTANELVSAVTGILGNNPEILSFVGQTTEMAKVYGKWSEIFGMIGVGVTSMNFAESSVYDSPLPDKIINGIEVGISSIAVRIPEVGLGYFFLDKTYGTAIRKTADAAAKVNAYYDQDPVGLWVISIHYLTQCFKRRRPAVVW